ncbi:hypothetical protein QOZ80_6AG0529460 [Eleusine coracana subsp. coracana]|nr:hypothetical protein QOZ80_6AG0529460 [Eleusine coracana subsp. coracana]
MQQATKKRRTTVMRTQDEELCSAAADRLSSLPDELIGRILSFLPTRQAVLTCQLSRRWRRVWASCAVALNLSVRDCVKRHRFRPLAREALLRFPTPDIPSVSVEIDSHIHIVDEWWFDQAMERAVGSVRFASLRPLIGMELPRCTRAESLAVRLPGTVLSLPPVVHFGFGRLTELSLSKVRLGGTRHLDEFLSSCCPRLCRLRLCCVRGDPVRRLLLHTDALQVLHVNNVGDLTSLHVETANLRCLSVRSCFRRSPPLLFPTPTSTTKVTVSAPMIESLHWYRSYPKHLSFRAHHLKHARRLSGLKLPALGRLDQFDVPYTLQLLGTCFLADHLDLELIMPDDMTLLNWLGPEEGQHVPPPQGDHRWGRVRTDDRLHHDWLRDINVDGLKGTDPEEYGLIELLLRTVPPSLERMSLRFRDAKSAVVDEVAAEITARFPMATGSWARCPPNVLTWSRDVSPSSSEQPNRGVC